MEHQPLEPQTAEETSPAAEQAAADLSSAEHRALLTPEHVAALEAIEADAQPDCYQQMLEYLNVFVAAGVAEGRFTPQEAAADLELALWYGYVCLCFDVYEQYCLARRCLAGAEQNAHGCGAWYYHYATALMYCGEPALARDSIEQGLREDPGYPWGWLLAAELRSHFGQQDAALRAVAQGLALRPGNPKFLQLREDLLSNASLEQMESHSLDGLELDPDEEPPAVSERRRSVAGIVCDPQKLAEIQEVLQISNWEFVSPYCHCDLPLLGRTVHAVFLLNEAAVSKLSSARLLEMLELLEEEDSALREQMRNNGSGRTELVCLLFHWNYGMELVYRSVETGELIRFAWPFQMLPNGADSPWPDYLKFYKQEDDVLRYSECWYDEKGVTLHQGVVGSTGERRILECDSFAQYQRIAAQFFEDCSAAGYAPWPEEDYNWIVVQFPIPPFDEEGEADAETLELRNVAYEALNDGLGWRGLGAAESWEMGVALDGSDTFVLDIYCCTVEIPQSVGAILESLEQVLDCAHLKIAVCPAGAEDYELTYAADCSETFSL